MPTSSGFRPTTGACRTRCGMRPTGTAVSTWARRSRCRGMTGIDRVPARRLERSALMRTLILASALAIALVPMAGPSTVLAQTGGAVDEDLLINSAGFLAAHPDLNNRHRGMQAYEDGRHQAALTYFRRGARYADKASQAMVAEMLWKGEGGERDPALAYAWMDLAAERGYPGFTVLRERYWAQLDQRQRQEAVARGEQVYAEYGDAVAQP